jgi:hypothetical protein
VSRLTKTLDKLKRRGALRSTTRRMGVFIDEYGYQTRPPDPIGGIPLNRQDLYLQRAAYLAWGNSRIKLFTQYLWRDEPRMHGSYAGWQSGLRFSNNDVKPSLAHFDTPFAIDAKRRRLWGQFRPGGVHTITVQSRRDAKGAKWRKVATVRTDARGYFTLSRRVRAKTRYRYRSGSVVSAALRP